MDLKWKGSAHPRGAAEDRLRGPPARSAGRPAFLDEATSALDTANERQLYEQVAAAQIDVVSVGTREGLLPFHDVLLELLGDDHWRITPVRLAAFLDLTDTIANRSLLWERRDQ